MNQNYQQPFWQYMGTNLPIDKEIGYQVDKYNKSRTSYILRRKQILYRTTIRSRLERSSMENVKRNGIILMTNLNAQATPSIMFKF